MREVLLLKLGEMILKGLNRRKFEDRLRAELKTRLARCGACAVESRQSTFYIEPGEGFDMDGAEREVCRIFGIVAVCRAAVCEKSLESIAETALSYLGEKLSRAATFKVESKRSDKTFAHTSPEISVYTAGRIAERYPELRADMKNPEITVTAEVRERAAYVHADAAPGAGGLPAGINGRATLLISGGIDSPVAGWLMARRGLALSAVHFDSYPYTSGEAREKVINLSRILAGWTGPFTLRVAPFTVIQEEIRDNCPEELSTVILRRFMLRVAGRIALHTGSGALVTGESLGQVASQTLAALTATDAVAALPVFRPLIGLDKADIITYARRIGTFDTSILPFEDCCTVFTPRHPSLNPRAQHVERAERALGVEELTEAAARGVEEILIN